MARNEPWLVISKCIEKNVILMKKWEIQASVFIKDEIIFTIIYGNIVDYIHLILQIFPITSRLIYFVKNR